MDIGLPEIGLILLAVLLLFGYKKLPDASRALGRSLRIFKGEMRGMQDDDRASSATSPAVTGGVVTDAEAVTDAEGKTRAR